MLAKKIKGRLHRTLRLKLPHPRNGAEIIYSLRATTTTLLDRGGKWLKDSYPHKIVLMLSKGNENPEQLL